MVDVNDRWMLWFIGFASDAICKLLRLLYLEMDCKCLCKFDLMDNISVEKLSWDHMKEKSSGKGSRSSGNSFLNFSYLMWNKGLCGLRSVASFWGVEIFGQCVEQLFLPKINVGRCGFFDGIVLSDCGIGFSISSCFIHCDELKKSASNLLKLFVDRVDPIITGLLSSRTSFSGWKLLWCCWGFDSAQVVGVFDMKPKLFRFFGSAANPRT